MIAFLRRHDAPLAPAYRDAPVVADYFRHREEEGRRRRGEYWRLFGVPAPVPQRLAAGTPAAHAGRVASARPPPDRGLADLSRGRGRAGRGEGLPAPLLHPLLGPLGADRAGRHGELELRACRQPRHGGPPVSVQLRDAARAGDARVRGPRAEAAGHDPRRAGRRRSENNQRGFYGRWRQFMQAASWADLKP
jgi:hypothetical protein